MKPADFLKEHPSHHLKDLRPNERVSLHRLLDDEGTVETVEGIITGRNLLKGTMRVRVDGQDTEDDDLEYNWVADMLPRCPAYHPGSGFENGDYFFEADAFGYPVSIRRK